MTALERLNEWANNDSRRVYLVGETLSDSGVLVWTGSAQFTKWMDVSVSAGLNATPEAACQTLIDRLAIAGVEVPA